MPTLRKSIAYSSFTGGLNEDDDPTGLAPEDLRICRNMYWEGAALSSRPGATRLQSTAINSSAAGVGVFEFLYNSGANQEFVAVFGNKIYKNAKASSPTDITGTVTITTGQNNHCGFATFNDQLIVVNGVDAPIVWTGTGNVAALGGTPPLAKTILTKWNRAFLAGQTAARRTIRYSALGDATSWPAASTVAAILGDSSSAIEGRDYIYQLGHLGDSIFVGLKNSIGRVLYTGDSTTPFRYTQLADFGCEGAHSYVAVGDSGYFLSQRGVHYITPSTELLAYESSEVSGRRLRTFWSSLNRNRIQYTYGTLYRTRAGNTLVLWPLTSTGATIHDVMLVMDITDGPGKERFSVWTGWDANAMAAIHNASSFLEELLFVTTVGFVWQPDDGTTSDNGTAYVKEAATRWEDFGIPDQDKSLRELYLETKQSGTHNLTINSYFNYAPTAALTQTQTLASTAQAAWGSPSVWGTDVWPSLGYLRAYLFGVGEGAVMSWRFSTAGASQPFSLYKFAANVLARSRSRETT